MSNALHHVATASFFPTTTELASGLQWFKEHPVLAAAAATAVSVITYWSATEASTLTYVEDEEGNKDTSSRSSSRKLHPCEGKLSAAVSWCDEHGGSLTQVFEELRVDDELDNHGRHRRRSPRSSQDDSRDAEEPSKYGSTTDTAVSASPTASEMAVRSRQQPVGRADMEPSLLARVKDDPLTPTELDLQTESPQWGWYVAITPPQDHVHPHLPRAVAPPMRHGIMASGTVNMAGSSLPRAPVSSLRRSTSGRIP